jgi:Protein of unknown function (DUF2026)
MKPNSLLLTLPEYGRIFKVIYSVLDGRANTPHACMFFSVAGSLLLNKHHKIPAKPVSGAFLLQIGQDSAIFIGGQKGNEIVSSETEFHCWIQTEHHIIDFMSPIFKESFKDSSMKTPIARKMFQRLLEDESPSINEMSRAGDFYTIPNIDMTENLVDKITSRPTAMDLLNVCDIWYEKYPKKVSDVALQDDLGQVHKLELKGPAIVGAW